MSAIELVEKSQVAERPEMKSGDTVRVHVKVPPNFVRWEQIRAS